MRVLAGKCSAWGGAARVPTPQGPETDSPETRGPETDLVRRPSPETTVPGGDPRKCRETAVYPGKAWHRATQVRFTTCPKHKGKETLSVKACRTAPRLNPNMKPQKNKARPQRPQFFLPGLLKVALLPGH